MSTELNDSASDVTSVVPVSDMTIDSSHETPEQIQATMDSDVVVESTTTDLPVNEPVKAAPVKSNRRSDPTEAVKAAIAKQREAERRAEAAEARVQQLVQPLPVESETAPDWSRFKNMPGVPRVEQFDAYEDYSMALAAFVADARHQERDVVRHQAYQQRQIEESQQQQQQQWMSRLRDASAQDPELMASLNPDTPMSLPMQHLAMDSPVGIEMLKWLSANPEESQRLSTLHPAETYREMGKLEARLEAASVRGPARVVSSAKAPIKPLGTSPPVADPFAITDELSMDEHFRRMNAADRAAGRM
ncbi:hypothetical protein UFOVP1017_38 [uncultured Caudovirales phage]|uniref:Uncharacterized protein n=1 Tax=uncultured Caudovirales phage TaxID=2100421 RepID=A0A6J5R8D6_9CAUD|nr:hypothetical protein UFOVP511_38 [uncultured Caudovirales phage]CAB4178531.1 hypothetical protein UFOVP1017_38 [uncultured Caudovirales phage]CAB4187974.1 hypothetical protein UFOVP1168_38 [uncultured Caudovirales phage]CAB4219573.1 hypothetical protein UFOVP1617_15 [uncultured Caudovirales phage]